MKLKIAKKWHLSHEMVKFIGVGLINTLFGYAIYAFLILVNLPYVAALLLSTIAGVTFNYFTIGRLVFKSRGGLTIFCKFIASYTIVYLVNIIGLASLIIFYKIGPYVGQAFCVPLSVILSWLMMNYWVFKK